MRVLPDPSPSPQRAISAVCAIALVAMLAVAGPARADDSGKGGHSDDGGGGKSGGGGGGGAATSSSSATSTNSATGGGATRDDDISLVRLAVANGEALPLSQILRALKRLMPGKVLSVGFARLADGYVYNFALLDDSGRYFDVTMDAKRASLIEVRRR